MHGAIPASPCAGNLLELMVLDRPQGPAVILTMPMRAQYRRLLTGGRER